MSESSWGRPTGGGPTDHPPSDGWPFGAAPEPAPWGNPAGEVLATGVPAGSVPPGGAEVLGGSVLPSEPPARGSGARRGVLLGVAVLVAGVVTGGAGLGYLALSGGGDQPEQHLPGNAVAFAKVDLNPDAGQKLNAVRFLMRLPRVKDDLNERTDLRQWVFERFTEGSGTDVTWAEVDPWLGDRAGVAVLPGAGGEQPHPVAALQVKDEQKATSTLRTLGSGVGFVVKDGWAVLAEDQAIARSAADLAASEPLSAAGTFAADLEALGQDGIATAWFDGPGLSSIVDDLAGTLGTASAGLDSLRSSAHGALALRFDGPRLELAGRFAGLKDVPVLSADGNPLGTLPNDTLVGFGVTGVGEQLSKAWERQLQSAATAQGLSAEELDAQVEGVFGLQLPEDAVALFGDRLTLALGGPDPDGNPSLGARGSGKDADQALDRVVAVLGRQGLPVERRAAGSDWVLASTSAMADSLVAGGKLGETARFKAVVPTEGGAVPVVYADLAGFAAAYPDLQQDGRDLLDALGAVGVSSSVDGDTMTVSVRVGRP